MLTSARDLTVINLFGPPGVGKSAMSAQVFGAMKVMHFSVGHVQEYAKDLLLRLPPAPNHDLARFLSRWQLKIFAEQNHRQQVLAGTYQFAVTDSPLLLGVFYAPDDFFPSFEALAQEVFGGYNNINFFLSRDLARTPFESAVRAHDEADSAHLGPEMREMLTRMGVPFTDIDLDEPDAVAQVLSRLPLPT